MNFLQFALAIISISVISTTGNTQVQRPIGSNISDIKDWSTEYVFKDAFKQSRHWISHENAPGAAWSSNIAVPLDPQGYPLEIPYDNGINPPQIVRTIVLTSDQNPSGLYNLKASGTGQIRLWGKTTGIFTCPVDTMIQIPTSPIALFIEIEQSIASDPVKNIRVVFPGYQSTYETAPFYPSFLDFIDDFEVIRFMDWFSTNNSDIMTWSDRGKEDYYTNIDPAYEHLIDLCNLKKKDAWVCIPHKADDNFISELAQLLNDSLNPTLKIYIEYSNEVWNGGFLQNQYAAAEGLALGYTGQPWERTWKYYAKRTSDVLQIFETEFQSAPDRLIKVVASQAASSWVSDYILDRMGEIQYNPTQIQADVLAIAPYFGGAVADVIGDAGLQSSITVPDILDSMQLSLQTSFDIMDDQKAVADAHGLELIAYEGGQHLAASPTYHNDTAYVAKLIAANHDPLMQAMYCDYFNHWYDSTQAGIFVNFTSHGLYSKYGSWGVKEYMNDTLNPKYLGLQNCVFSYNSIPSDINITDVQVHCDSITWIDGNTYYSDNSTATHTYCGGSTGADTIVSLDLTINSVDVSTTVNGLNISVNVSGGNYQWLDCDNNFAPIQGETSQAYQATTNGNYAAQVTDNGCIDTTNCISIQNVGFSDLVLEGVYLYPNPTNGDVTIEFGSLTDVNVNVYNSIGVLVYQKKSITTPYYQFNLLVSKGVYFVEVVSNGLTKRFPLILE